MGEKKREKNKKEKKKNDMKKRKKLVDWLNRKR